MQIDFACLHAHCMTRSFIMSPPDAPREDLGLITSSGRRQHEGVIPCKIQTMEGFKLQRNYSPLDHLCLTAALLALTPSLKLSSNGKVCSSEMQASVILTPYLRPAGPSGGTDCLPSLILLSIMTPRIIDDEGPEASWAAIS